MPKTKQDWLSAGMQILSSESGVSGLTIEKLCQILEVTKGSFYHHFKNQQDYRVQLLAYWQEEDTNRVIEIASKAYTHARQIDALMDILSHRTTGATDPELAIRAWALQDESIRSYVAEIDRQRVGYIAEMLREVVNDESRAQLLAGMLYAILVGSYSMIPRVGRETVLDLYREFATLYDR